MSDADDVGIEADVRRILAERAIAFAKRPGKWTVAGDEVVLFRVLQERFALQLSSVVEIARVKAITPLPGAAQPIAGVVAWRGRAVLIIDFAQPARSDIVIDDETRLIIIGERGHVIGFVADEVEDVTRIDATVLTQTTSESWRGQVIRGLSTDAILILEPVQLLRQFAAPGTTPSR